MPKQNAEEIRQELKEASKPLIDFLYKYGTPHHVVIVTQANSELLGGEIACENDLRD